MEGLDCVAMGKPFNAEGDRGPVSTIKPDRLLNQPRRWAKTVLHGLQHLSAVEGNGVSAVGKVGGG